jgi:hypothetical protein
VFIHHEVEIKMSIKGVAKHGQFCFIIVIITIILLSAKISAFSSAFIVLLLLEIEIHVFIKRVLVLALLLKLLLLLLLFRAKCLLTFAHCFNLLLLALSLFHHNLLPALIGSLLLRLCYLIN